MTACVSGTLRDVGAGSGINGRGGSGARTKSRAASHPATDGRADLQPSTDPPPSVLPQRKAVPTMRDIAAAAKVSQSTVSRVLNNAPTRVPIAEETRERVTLAARRLGYRPNPLARGLRGAPTMLLGAVVRDITDPFFAGAIEALSIEAMARGYNVVLGHAHGRADEGDGADDRPRDPPLRRDRPARRHAGPAAVARGPADVAASRSSRSGRARACWTCRRSTSTTGPASAPGSSTSSTSVTPGSRSSAAATSATSVSAKQRSSTS